MLLNLYWRVAVLSITNIKLVLETYTRARTCINVETYTIPAVAAAAAAYVDSVRFERALLKTPRPITIRIIVQRCAIKNRLTSLGVMSNVSQ